MADHILVVDDIQPLRTDLRWVIEKADPSREVTEARNELEAEHLLASKSFDVVVTDIKLDEAGGSEIGGLKVLEAARKKDPLTQVIVVTAYGGILLRPEHQGRQAALPVRKYVRQLGAFACIERNQPGAEFLEVVREKVDQALKLRNSLLREQTGRIKE
jgi:DNA-binding NtrC family response regulator